MMKQTPKLFEPGLTVVFKRELSKVLPEYELQELRVDASFNPAEEAGTFYVQLKLVPGPLFNAV